MKPDDNVLEYLERTGKYSDWILFCAGVIELYSVNLILKLYKLSTQDKRSKPLLDMNLARQLAIPIENGVLPSEEFRIVDDFREKRNHFIHELAGMHFSLIDRRKEMVSWSVLS